MKQPQYVVDYNGAPLGEALRDNLIRIDYRDALSDESDAIDIDISDPTGKWHDNWLPDKGLPLSLWLGYAGEPLSKMGDFYLDQLEFSAPPQMVRLRGLAIGFGQALRTNKSVVHKDTTLAKIVTKIAAAHKLTVKGAIPKVNFDSLTQMKQTDLQFLRKLAHDFGCIVKIVDNSTAISFVAIDDLVNQNEKITITPNDVSRWSIDNSLRGLPKRVNFSFHDNAENHVTQFSEPTETKYPTSDSMDIVAPVKDLASARIYVKAEIARAKRKMVTVNLSLPGNAEMIAGEIVALSGFGQFNGKYLVTSARHSLVRQGGFTTNLTLILAVI